MEPQSGRGATPPHAQSFNGTGARDDAPRPRTDAASGANETEWGAQFLLRLKRAADGRTYRCISEMVWHNPETVRRYMTGATLPNAAFIAEFCKRLDISADWLLLGQEPMRPGEREAAALKTASTSALFARVAELVEHKARAAKDSTALLPGAPALDTDGASRNGLEAGPTHDGAD